VLHPSLLILLLLLLLLLLAAWRPPSKTGTRLPLLHCTAAVAALAAAIAASGFPPASAAGVQIGSCAQAILAQALS